MERGEVDKTTMFFMQHLVKRQARRRHSKSPNASDDSPGSSKYFFGSKHKRRAFLKNASYTEGESLCSEDSVDCAPWRVGTSAVLTVGSLEL